VPGRAVAPGAARLRSGPALRTKRTGDKIPTVPTTRELLETTIDLEKRSMSLYARFAKIFAANPALHEFWFGMARDEARHVGSLDLVLTVLEFEGVLDKPSPIPVREGAVERLRETLQRYLSEPAQQLPIDRALTIALEVEESELEEMVGDLLRALQQHDEYERCQRLLVHDLGELSYMIEQYCQDPALLQRCDELVDHHAETLRTTAAGR
jgi:rubrerythrin